MKGQIRLGRIYGIEIGLHYSWIIIAVLITLSLGQYFSRLHADWSGSTIWGISILTAILFFGSIIIHELSHAAVARARDIPVRSIVLFALGGVAQIEGEAPDGKTEFWMGIIGPITSAVLGLLCLGIAYLLGWAPGTESNTPLMSMLVWLGYINIVLAIFNMLPGFPMDGGRVLRGIIWMVTGNSEKATRIASLSGQFVAFALIIFGLFTFFSGSGLGGLWLVFIGWFLLNAARSSYAQFRITEDLRGIKVRDLMSRDYPAVDSRMDLQTFVSDHLLKTGQNCFVVVENNEPVGLITSNEIKSVDRKLWPFKTAADVMEPIGQNYAVDLNTPAEEALQIIGREGVSQLPVVSGGRLAGVFSRDRILRYLLTRQELHL
jgi:Zn-dependent protease/predicted transcriptional regulator